VNVVVIDYGAGNVSSVATALRRLGVEAITTSDTAELAHADRLILPGVGHCAALGDKKGILRAGYFLMPMDETLAAAAVDFGGRAFCVVKARFSAKRVGDFQTELVEDFFQGFAQAARANVHLRVLYGRSSHHQVEAVFKAFARALRFALSRDKRLRGVLPSTKELL